jgi:hypothetical protein
LEEEMICTLAPSKIYQHIYLFCYSASSTATFKLILLQGSDGLEQDT